MKPLFWRKWHRWIAFPATLFLLWASITRIITAGTEFFGADEELREAMRKVVSPVTTASSMTPWAERLDRAMKVVNRVAADAPVDKITIQLKGPTPGVTVYTGKPGGGEDRRFVIDSTGALVETGAYVDKALIHRLHSGEAFGDGGLVMAMFWGLALAVLAMSGFIIYTTMWRPNQTGMKKLFW